MTQKAISLKVDEELLKMLNEYCNKSGEKRNRVINNAVATYLEKK